VDGLAVELPRGPEGARNPAVEGGMSTARQRAPAKVLETRILDEMYPARASAGSLRCVEDGSPAKSFRALHEDH